MHFLAGQKLRASDLNEGPWVPLTLLAGWVQRTGYYVPAVRLLMDESTVQLRGGLSGGTVTAGTVFATLAAEFRPAASVSFAVSANDSGAGGAAGNPRVFVRTNGNMEIWGIAGTSPFHIDGCSFSI
ncbi:hypothetical protein FHU38_000976 [Saccharomonospora amisosensis]|uniref:Uncharacterized protein n=1 Tax=Saccharomonospora amisosensis TaxID=1128677 RepID=A0A7X5ZPE0_9PSEU|nr:hypothetical protein [Saccharomonospora amisosensis]NIJ10632.1 hypothetical protein [Saccharomonospora amisosensis]